MLTKTLILVSAFIVGTTAYGSSPGLSPFGIVEGIKDCGTKGILGEVQVTNCTTLPCQVFPYTLYDFSVKFTAGATSSILVLQVIKSDDLTNLYDSPLFAQIEAGREYKLEFMLFLGNSYIGKTFPIRIYLWELLRVELCAAGSLQML